MKLCKTFLSFLLSLTFLAPTLSLTACKNEETESAYETPTIESPSEEEIEEITPPNETPSEEEPQPPQEEPQPPVVEYAQYIRTTTNGVNIRSGAGTSYAVYAQAEKGETYAVVGQTGNWYKTYYRGKTAYVSTSYAAVFSLEKADAEVEEVLEEGYRVLGVPYVYGAVRLHDGKGNLLSGFSAQKFDCSSLVQYMFYHGADKLLDVTTRTQVKQGVFVSPNDLQRGDCIFFTNESRQHLSGIQRVGHVAVYLGNNYILHTSSDYARIEKMTAARWNFYIETRRFV
ncbi:MAG: C40 family peptidase [Clostridia bacterium]|nr:C40 family peptidase [Clostridia bacterium]